MAMATCYPTTRRPDFLILWQASALLLLASFIHTSQGFVLVPQRPAAAPRGRTHIFVGPRRGWYAPRHRPLQLWMQARPRISPFFLSEYSAKILLGALCW